MQSELATLKSRLATVTDLNAAASVLNWDQATLMPDGGETQRGRQLATLSTLSHEMMVAPETGALIDKLSTWADTQPEGSMDRAFVRETRRQRDLLVRVPADFYGEMVGLHSQIYAAWTKAKPANDFKTVQPLLEKSVAMSRQFAGYFTDAKHPMDALMEFADSGSTLPIVQELFKSLRERLVPLVKAVTARPLADDTCLQGDFDETSQLSFCRDIAERLGYDFKRGRIDKSPHPFMTRFAGDDIRITTRVRRDDFTDCFFSVIHEVGHALYELGIDPALDGNILGNGVSSGVHESQSRLWENRVARGRPFWTFAYPILQKAFPHFSGVPLDTFLKAINRVEPSLIRVDADELTYNLHVMIRFDIESALIDGSLNVKDLPEAWNARYKSDLGITPLDFKTGCMQDVHWFGGRIGGVFQGYTIGNILSAQFYDAAKRQIPDLEEHLRQGEFKTLRTWLNTNVHRTGAMTSPHEVIRRATGQDLTIEPYMAYLSAKYGELYGIKL